MVDMDTLRQLALSLPQVTEDPHFDKTSYRINKKIFATAVPGHNRATVKLSPADQDLFCTFDSSVIYPVPNKWGLQGCTLFELSTVRQDMLEDALTTAWQSAIGKRVKKK